MPQEGEALHGTAAIRAALAGFVAMKPKLKIGWVPTTADTTHAGLAASGGRDYASNGWGLQRKDFGK